MELLFDEEEEQNLCVTYAVKILAMSDVQTLKIKEYTCVECGQYIYRKQSAGTHRQDLSARIALMRWTEGRYWNYATATGSKGGVEWMN